MVDQNRTQRVGRMHFRERVRIERFLWHTGVVALHLIPPAWLGGSRLNAYAEAVKEKTGSLWIAPELDSYIPGLKLPCPEPELASFLLAEQPFREILVLVTGEQPGLNGEWWRQCFLESCFDRLNGLYLVSGRTLEREEKLFDWMYEQSGLPVCVTSEIPLTEGKKTVVVDCRLKQRPPVRKFAPATLYLDLTSDPEKQRILKQKRTDISYISARNYLDTAFKARYNAI